ncbi:MAG TPA: biotin transporter BioY, partial [Candidatus Methanofastidiosa archaeon]|nr:biotin transporter BioY [Candidatus Methanofastidiosa archaeon]
MKSTDLALTALFATLTAIGAFIQIPFIPVPLTLQTFFVLLSGMLLGARLGALSQIIYMMMGAIGLPVFAGGTSGPGVITGPTGGYLVGFVVGAFCTGLCVEKSMGGAFVKGRKMAYVLRDAIALGAGIAAIYACGILQLMNFLDISLYSALKLGVVPFLLGDLLKSALAISLAERIR